MVWLPVVTILMWSAPVYASQPNRPHDRTHNYQINPKPCSVNRLEGTCMFVWECIKTDGNHIGMCVDAFMFGSCCAHNLTAGELSRVPNNTEPAVLYSQPRPSRPTRPSHPSQSRPIEQPHRPHFMTALSSTASPHPPQITILSPQSNGHYESSTEKVMSFHGSLLGNAYLSSSQSTSSTERWSHQSSGSHINISQLEAEAGAGSNLVDATWTPSAHNWPGFITRPRPGKPRPSTVTILASSHNPSTRITTTSTSSTTTTTTTTTTSTTTPSPPTTGSTTTTSTVMPTPSDVSTSTSLVTTARSSMALPSSNNHLPSVSATQHSSECGIAPLHPRHEVRIVGGRNSQFGVWPWQISVRRTSFFGFSSTHRCGGALLNEQWIATAGHCVDDLLTSQIRIRVGEYDFSSVNEPYPFAERGVTKKVVHPKYNFFTYEYDLALVRLDAALEFAPHILPICLPASDDLLIGENATVTGWGRLSEGGTLPSVLQEVTVPIVSNEKCKNMFLRAGRHEFIPEIFMCAGFDDGGRDSCQGDSGGPLQVRGKDGRYFLAGIISWGIGCAEANLPGVCTRISKFVPWILQTVM